jgi:curli biogenesis system outer membrane secretion channel CsgG
MFKNMHKLTGLALAAILGAGGAGAVAAQSKIAVTDLSYQEKVKEYFHVVAATSKSSASGSGSVRDTDRSYSARGNYRANAESSYYEAEGTYTYIESGELRNYTADLKGALIKGGGVRLVQARPYAGKPTDQIHDIIARIKGGSYPGADYVLFGTVSNIEFRQEQMPLSGSVTATLSLDLVADFSLINTKTYEVKAAFSANGSGQDTKILSNSGDRIAHNRGKVISETSKSLADAAYAELMVQFGLPGRNRESGASAYRTQGTQGNPAPEPRLSPVTQY